MRSTALISLAFLTATVFAACGFDIHSDDAVKKAYIDQTGASIRPSNVCLRRPDALKQLVVVGETGIDRPCSMEGYFLGQTWTSESDVDVTAVLTKHGWASADEASRERMAKAVLKYVIAPRAYLLNKASEAFKGSKHAYTAPEFVTSDDGSSVLTMWIRFSGHPMDITARDRYTKVKLRIGPKGKHTYTKVAEFSK